MAKAPSPFLALLRGINVGGKNVIAMDALRRCFEELKFTNVRTYIQSGNVLFRSDETSVRQLTKTIEDSLTKRLSCAARAVVLSHKKYKTAVRAAHDTWGKDDDQKHHALFTIGGISAKGALAQLQVPKSDIETVTIGPGVIFWSVSKKQLTKTTLMNLSRDPVYQRLTVRNHNTVFKLLELLEAI